MEGDTDLRMPSVSVPRSRCNPSIPDVCPCSRYFAAGHYYNAYLDLSFPDSSSNHDCGMVTIDMRALSDRTTLASALHSFLPQYTSPLVRWMWSWTFALPLVTGLIREQQSITLPMFDQLAEQEQRPISTFEIKIKTSKQHEFHLYKATLRLQVQLFGLRSEKERVDL